ADDIARGVNVENRSLIVVVDHQLAAAIGLDAGGLDLQLVAVGLAADGVQERLPANNLAALELGENLRAILVEAHRNDLLAEAKNRSQLTQLIAEALDDLAVYKIQQRGALVEQNHFHSQSAKH